MDIVYWPLTCAAGAHVMLCEVCERAPAAVTCKADAATLCTTCDADIHAANSLASGHERVPVSPFYIPAATWPKEVAAGADAISFFADADPFLHTEYEDILVPVTCGGRAPPQPVDFAMGKPASNSYDERLMSHSISSSEVGVVPEDAFAASLTSMTDAANNHSRPIRNPTATMDREARVMRYREKRKNRKFEKTIRYASRKAYAESRPRIKGRFVKRENADFDADPIYSVPDNGYGLVPSF